MLFFCYLFCRCKLDFTSHSPYHNLFHIFFVFHLIFYIIFFSQILSSEDWICDRICLCFYQLKHSDVLFFSDTPFFKFEILCMLILPLIVYGECPSWWNTSFSNFGTFVGISILTRIILSVVIPLATGWENITGEECSCFYLALRDSSCPESQFFTWISKCKRFLCHMENLNLECTATKRN